MSSVSQLRKNGKILDELCLATPKKKWKSLRWALSGV